jgi:hypothetical protein
MASPDHSKSPAPGDPVDAYGNSTIDPTKNVLDLVRAESIRQDGLRDAESRLHRYAIETLEKFQNYARDTESKMQTLVRNSETQRLDQLAVLRQTYEARIADMLAVSVKSTSDLVSTQLVQIQATFNDRVSKLEQFRWESGGADQGQRDKGADQRGNVAMIVGVASFGATVLTMIIGVVMYVVVSKTPSIAIPSPAPTIISPSAAPVNPK